MTRPTLGAGAPAGDGHPGTEVCPGCGAVIVRGLRDQAAQDVRTAALLQLATDAYAAQHLVAGAAPRLPTRPVRWTTAVADLAADLDVVDLPSLVRSWADAVWTDWSPAHPALRAAADVVPIT